MTRFAPFLAAFLFLLPGPASPMGGALPPGLPAHFAFGSQSYPGGAGSRAWMDATRASHNAQWDYRYTYFNAGVNTGFGWSTWNSPAGHYATLYMNDSDAGGYIPVLVYYQMLQSNPASGATESDKDFNNLNNASTMNAYYADYKLLLQKVAAFGKTVIIHLEPDLFGYMQKDHCGGDDAANCPAAVASSGHADAAGLPDTFEGYCRALRRMRDSYAPNARLAVHLSWWASGQDLMAATWMNQAQLEAEADKTIAFLSSCGRGSPGPFDLFFFEFSDRDASHKWSTGNTTYWWSASAANIGGSPNTFARHVHLLNRVSDGLGLRSMGWQIPCGNASFRTCNNATRHWRSPYAEYILGGYPGPAGASHVRDYAQAGALGMLFGAGAADQTHPWDEAGDGVTNGANVSNYGSAQGSATATLSDDDGGYLRVNVGAYYSAGSYPLSGAPTPTPSATASPVLSPTPTPSATPDCPSAFNRCESLSENGVWSGALAVRSLDSGVAAAITEGSSSVKAQITGTQAWWNEGVLALGGFSPSVWQPYNAVSFDLYVDPAAVPWTGASTVHAVAVHGSSASVNKWSQPMTADIGLAPGLNRITATLQWGLGTLLSSNVLSQIQFNLKIDDPSTGVIHIDNIVLHTGGSCPPSPTPSVSPTPSRSPSASPTGSPTSTTSPSATATATASPSSTPSADPSGSPTSTASVTLSAGPSASPSASPTPTPSPTPSDSPGASPTPTMSAGASATTSPTPLLPSTPSPSPGVSAGPSPSASPTPTGGLSSTPSLSPSSTESPLASPSPTVTATGSAGVPSPSLTASPTAAAWSATAGGTGGEILELRPWHNPIRALPVAGAVDLALRIRGRPRSVQVALYTRAMVRLGSWSLDLHPEQGGDWRRLRLDGVPPLAGAYFARAEAGGTVLLTRLMVLP